MKAPVIFPKLPVIGSPLFKREPSEEWVKRYLRALELSKQDGRAKFLKPMLYLKQAGRCGITGERMWPPGAPHSAPHACSLDHKLPRARGGGLGKGTNEGFDNLWLICHWVNQDKGDLTVEEYIEAKGLASLIPGNTRAILPALKPDREI